MLRCSVTVQAWRVNFHNATNPVRRLDFFVLIAALIFAVCSHAEETPELVLRLRHSSAANTLAFLPDGRKFIAPGESLKFGKVADKTIL